MFTLASLNPHPWTGDTQKHIKSSLPSIAFNASQGSCVDAWENRAPVGHRRSDQNGHGLHHYDGTPSAVHLLGMVVAALPGFV